MRRLGCECQIEEKKRSGSVAETSKELAEWRRLQRKNFVEHSGSAEKERVVSVPHREQLAGTPELPLQN